MTPSQSPSVTTELDPVIHEATRLRIIAVMSECAIADFNFLLGTLSLTRGNLSVHIGKLVTAGYVEEKKDFVDKKSHTEYRLTTAGRAAYRQYLRGWKRLTGN
ncbi:MAG: transcriptional regulator [Planctomycetota bacterium]